MKVYICIGFLENDVQTLCEVFLREEDAEKYMNTMQGKGADYWICGWRTVRECTN